MNYVVLNYLGCLILCWESLFKHEYQTDTELLNMLLQIQSPETYNTIGICHGSLS